MGIKLGNVKQTKAGSATYETTTATKLFNLPSQSMVIGAKANGVASDAATTGVLTLTSRPMNSTTKTTMAVMDVKTATAGVDAVAVLPVAGIAFTRQSHPVVIEATYTETGTAANAGSWTVLVDYL
jgi:ABC-type molybdate transport system substrate-binding protein